MTALLLLLVNVLLLLLVNVLLLLHQVVVGCGFKYLFAHILMSLSPPEFVLGRTFGILSTPEQEGKSALLGLTIMIMLKIQKYLGNR